MENIDEDYENIDVKYVLKENEILQKKLTRLEFIVSSFDPEQHPYIEDGSYYTPSMSDNYGIMQEQLKQLKKENSKIKVERNKAVRQLESFKKKISKLIEP